MNKNFLKSILLSGLILFPAMLAAQETDGGVAFKRWENTLEAGLNTNFSESSPYAVADFSIGLKYWFNDRWVSDSMPPVSLHTVFWTGRSLFLQS